MRLHVVDTDERYLPCDREAFRGVQAGAEAGAHAWPTSDGDEVGLGCSCFGQDAEGL